MAITPRERREQRKKKSTARRRAETHSTGYQTTCLKMPEGMGFWEMKTGNHKLDIVGYTVGKGNPYADPGELHYERTYFMYSRIGVEEKSYVASSKTFGKADFIQEYRQKESLKPDADPKYLKALEPKERQIFLVYDHGDPGKGLQLWECSFHTFGKLLDARIKNQPDEEDWDLFYYPDEDGRTLRITVEEQSGGDFKFRTVTSIDFIRRADALPDEIANHGHCLDDFLVETPYEELKKVFMHVEDDGGDSGKSAAGAETSTKEAPKTAKTEKKEEPPKKKKDPTAADFGLEAADAVMYQGEAHTIAKISGDGTSLTLIRDKDDELIKAIGPDEVVKKEDKDDDVPFETERDDSDDAVTAQVESGDGEESGGNDLDDEWDWD